MSDAEGDDVFSISSNAYVAVAIQDETLVIETFVMTVIIKTTIINGGVQGVNININKRLFQESNRRPP